MVGPGSSLTNFSDRALGLTSSPRRSSPLLCGVCLHPAPMSYSQVGWFACLTLPTPQSVVSCYNGPSCQLPLAGSQIQRPTKKSLSGPWLMQMPSGLLGGTHRGPFCRSVGLMLAPGKLWLPAIQGTMEKAEPKAAGRNFHSSVLARPASASFHQGAQCLRNVLPNILVFKGDGESLTSQPDLFIITMSVHPPPPFTSHTPFMSLLSQAV